MTSASSTPPTGPPRPRPPRLRFRFTLRLLLATLTLLCLALGLWTHRAREQRRAIERIEMHGGLTDYDFPTRELPNGEYQYESPLPALLIALLGNDFFHTVTEANIGDRTALPELERLPYLQTLIIKADDVTDADLAVLQSLPRLRTLWIHGGHHAQNRDTNLTLISDRSLNVIAKLPHLEEASVHGQSFTKKGIEAVGKAPKLKHLEIGSFDHSVTPEDFQSLRGLSRIQQLEAWRLHRRVIEEFESIAGW